MTTPRPYGSTRRRPSSVQRGRHDRVQRLCRLLDRGFTKRECMIYAESHWDISRATASSYANEAAGLFTRRKKGSSVNS